MSEIQSETASSTLSTDPTPGGDELAHLHKMSGTGSAFGATDYVAINPTSIAALLLGLAGSLALLVTPFIVVPVAGVICAWIALRQIGHSNGTQAGRAFAWAGLVLSLGLGGTVLGKQVHDWITVRADTRQCAAMIDRLGDQLHAERYEEAFDDMTSNAFRERPEMNAKVFRATFEQLQDPRLGYGHIEWAHWNGEPMAFDEVGDSGVKVGYAMAFVKFKEVKEPSRQLLRFTDRDGAWKLDNWERLFPDKKLKKKSSEKRLNL